MRKRLLDFWWLGTSIISEILWGNEVYLMGNTTITFND